MECFKVVVNHDAYKNPSVITFELMVFSEDNELPLHSRTFQHESFDSANKIIEAYKEWISRPEIQAGLMAKDLGRILGFEVDFSKSINNFFKDMARHTSTNKLEEYIRVITYEPLMIELENELKKRIATVLTSK